MTFSLSDHFPASWNLYIPVILGSQRENAHQASRQVQRLDDPVPKWKLTIVLIWKTSSCLKFGKTPNRAVEN